jgi:hypothetical protein
MLSSEVGHANYERDEVDQSIWEKPSSDRHAGFAVLNA